MFREGGGVQPLGGGGGGGEVEGLEGEASPAPPPPPPPPPPPDETLLVLMLGNDLGQQERFSCRERSWSLLAQESLNHTTQP